MIYRTLYTRTVSPRYEYVCDTWVHFPEQNAIHKSDTDKAVLLCESSYEILNEIQLQMISRKFRRSDSAHPCEHMCEFSIFDLSWNLFHTLSTEMRLSVVSPACEQNCDCANRF